MVEPPASDNDSQITTERGKNFRYQVTFLGEMANLSMAVMMVVVMPLRLFCAHARRRGLT